MGLIRIRLELTVAVAIACALSGCSPSPPSPTPTSRPVAFGWTAAPGMAHARAFHTATRLKDGRVLVAGSVHGAGDPNGLPTAEIYDPVAETWTETGSMREPRFQHAATLLPDGRVLVSGGFLVASAELFDAKTGTWTLTGSLSGPRARHTSTLLLDGRVLVVGGMGQGQNGLASAELYDATSGRWSSAGQMSVTRKDLSATLLRDGRVLVAGGVGSFGEYLAATEIYDPKTNSWTPTGSMTHGRSRHTATLLADGHVLVAGGVDGPDLVATAEIYDPATGSWSDTGSLNELREAHTATLLADGRVLVAGGYSQGTASAELYDPASGAWTFTTPMTAVRGFHTATLLGDGGILVAGGVTDTEEVVASAELYHAPPSLVPPTEQAPTGTAAAICQPGPLTVAGFLAADPRCYVTDDVSVTGWWDVVRQTDAYANTVNPPERVLRGAIPIGPWLGERSDEFVQVDAEQAMPPGGFPDGMYWATVTGSRSPNNERTCYRNTPADVDAALECPSYLVASKVVESEPPASALVGCRSFDGVANAFDALDDGSGITVENFTAFPAACFGSRDVRLRGWLDVRFLIAGWTEGWDISPGWLWLPIGPWTVLAPDSNPPNAASTLVVYVDPARKLDVSRTNRWVVLTGHYADAKAATCHVEYSADYDVAPPRIPDSFARRLCEAHFVVTSIKDGAG